ncbi:MAG: hypothetical protein J0H67_21760 [Rhodospirillales bacterium]|nr:hypothetical protein [Rhodospirillales bacterium]
MRTLDGGIVVANVGNTIPLSEPLDANVTTPGWPILPFKAFPEPAWDPVLRAQLLLAEFAATPWQSKVSLPPPDTTPQMLQSEIDDLIVKQRTLRGERNSEILAQSQDLTQYWADLLMVTPAAKPATWELLSGAMAIGHMVGMVFKAKFNRARPVQLYPALMPSLLTPPHPSYPNNHALQSYLISECLILKLEAFAQPLRELADRVGVNREVAGFHFPSDRRASKKLVEQILPILKAGPYFKALLDRVGQEWEVVTPIPHNTPWIDALAPDIGAPGTSR